MCFSSQLAAKDTPIANATKVDITVFVYSMRVILTRARKLESPEPKTGDGTFVSVGKDRLIGLRLKADRIRIPTAAPFPLVQTVSVIIGRPVLAEEIGLGKFGWMLMKLVLQFFKLPTLRVRFALDQCNLSLLILN
jgi:hypothetical protein